MAGGIEIVGAFGWLRFAAPFGWPRFSAHFLVPAPTELLNTAIREQARKLAVWRAYAGQDHLGVTVVSLRIEAHPIPSKGSASLVVR